MPHTVRTGAALATGLALSDLTFDEFWVQYLWMGGHHSRGQLITYLSGDTEWPLPDHDYDYDYDYDYDAAAQVLNERCADLHLGHPVLYAHEIRSINRE
jgi:hypothetical protein